MSQFLDQVRISIRSGDGGNGMVAWRREKYEPMGGPAGGSGGQGGSVYVKAHRDMNTLLDFRYKHDFEAERGGKGMPKSMHGRNAQDLILKVPVGTVVRDLATGQVIGDLIEIDQRVLIAEGGRGGRGNATMASSTRRAPWFCEPGQPGISREIELELKLLADVGLIGLPNAGKSTLLSIMTAARPKIADYPFSTLEPNLGVVKKPDGDGYVIADIPGLIKGASQGAGLGHKFLRHIERTGLLVHLADMGSPELKENIKTINDELGLYSQRLSSLPQILVLNKVDTVDDAQAEDIIKDIQNDLPQLVPAGTTNLLVISCATRAGVDQLSNLLLQRLSEAQLRQPLYELEPDEKAVAHPDEGFQVIRHKDMFTVVGDGVERLVAVTNMRSPESIHHLNQVLRNMGVIEELTKNGIEHGHEVMLGESTFTYGENLF